VAQLVALRVAPSAMGAWLEHVWEHGDAALPVDPDASSSELARVLRRLRPARLISGSEQDGWHEEQLADATGVDEGTALVVATSGSTGEPKGVELGHAALSASTRASLRRLGCRRGESWLGCLPTHHVAGIQTLLRSWELGTEPVVHDRFDVEEVARSEAPHVSLVPTQLTRLLEAGADLRHFDTVLLGGARPPARLLARAAESGVRVVLSYGMSETCGGCVYDGEPLDGVEVAIDEHDRVRLRGPVLFSGYRDDPQATWEAIDADGWFVTGDVGRWVDGRLEVVGRADDVVISGGENVPLQAVEVALRSHRGVHDAVAAGVEDPEWGHAVVAAVVPHDPQDPPTPDELRAHVRRGHPAAFAPRRVVLVDEIPRDELGKVTRSAVDRLLGE
jgi:o-succinylbenzoate---CoA ligase